MASKGNNAPPTYPRHFRADCHNSFCRVTTLLKVCSPLQSTCVANGIWRAEAPTLESKLGRIVCHLQCRPPVAPWGFNSCFRHLPNGESLGILSAAQSKRGRKGSCVVFLGKTRTKSPADFVCIYIDQKSPEDFQKSVGCDGKGYTRSSSKAAVLYNIQHSL